MMWPLEYSSKKSHQLFFLNTAQSYRCTCVHSSTRVHMLNLYKHRCKSNYVTRATWRATKSDAQFRKSKSEVRGGQNPKVQSPAIFQGGQNPEVQRPGGSKTRSPKSKVPWGWPVKSSRARLVRFRPHLTLLDEYHS